MVLTCAGRSAALRTIVQAISGLSTVSSQG
jgi:hypothetical protein